MRCCSGTFSTPASLGVRSWSCWWGRRRLSPSPSEMSRADDGGRSCRNGSAPTPPQPIFIAADRYGNAHKGAHAQTGAFCCLEFDVMREVNYSCLMMPQTGPALRGAFCFAPPQLAASSIFRRCSGTAWAISAISFLTMMSPNELIFSATMTNAPGPPMTLLR